MLSKPSHNHLYGKIRSGLSCFTNVFFLFSISIAGVAMADARVDYQKDIQPLLNDRCAACHSCYQAPCQLKLNSWDGVVRGLSEKRKVYNPMRLSSETPTRLFQDGTTKKDWREMDFFPVIPEYPNSKPEYSYIMTLVNQRVDHPGMEDLKKPEETRECKTSMKDLKKHLKKKPNYGMPYGLPALKEEEVALLHDWTQQGSTGPSSIDQGKTWAPSPNTIADIQKWEEFLNKDNDKSRLVSRYLYEHLFMANINFDPSQREFYHLVRSKNGCNILNGGQLIEEVRTKRPFGNPITRGERVSARDNKLEKLRWDTIQATGEFIKRDPKVVEGIIESYKSFNYCFRKVTAKIASKSHMLYKLSDKKLDRYQELFFDDKNDWQVKSLPGFVDEIPGTSSDNSNPFMVFQDIPAEARYRFLLDNAEYTIRTFIRGPVCRGGTAVNSIDEKFFVFFVDPKSDLFVNNKKYAMKTYDSLRTAPHYGSDIDGFFSSAGVFQIPKFWDRLKKEESFYRRFRAKEYRKRFIHRTGSPAKGGYGIMDIWRGDSKEGNPNAILTVMRHYDSASVNTGAMGSMSKTLLVLDYPLMERFVYNLAAGFDVFGDMGHQVLSRLYMSYLRSEGENNFLDFMPENSGFRKKLRNDWYKSAGASVEGLVNLFCNGKGASTIDQCHPLHNSGLKSKMRFNMSQANPKKNGYGYEQKLEFLRVALSHLGATVENGLIDTPLAEQMYGQSTNGDEDPIKAVLQGIADIPMGKGVAEGRFVYFLPNLAYLLVKDSVGGDSVYSVIRNKAHKNVLFLSSEGTRRDRIKDTMLVTKGFIGMYPNMFFVVDRSNLEKFVADMKAITTASDHQRFLNSYGMKQTNENFWESYDAILDVAIPTNSNTKQFLEGGIIDLNRYGIDYSDDSAPDAIGDKIRSL